MIWGRFLEKEAPASPIRHVRRRTSADVKPTKLIATFALALSLASLVLLTACGGSDSTPNPLPVADAGADAAADAAKDGEVDAGNTTPADASAPADAAATD